MIKEKQKLPSWFNGELYEEGDTVTNRLSGEEYELTEMIVSKIHNLFKEADCPEELDTTEVDNHKPVE